MNSKKTLPDLKPAINTALNYLNAGQLDFAAHIAQALQQQFPKNDQVLHLVGLVHIYQGDVNTGIQYIQKAIRKKPQAQYYQNLGSGFQMLKQFSDAIVCYQKALKLAKNPDIYLNLGFCYHHVEQYTKAIQYYQIFLKQQPNSPHAHYGLANSYFKQAEFATAIQHYHYALQADPQFILALFGLAETYLATEKITDCLQTIKQALNLNPHETKPYQLLAKATFFLQKNPLHTAIALYTGLLFTGSDPDVLDTLEELYVHKFIEALRARDLAKGWLYSRQRPIIKMLQANCPEPFIANDTDPETLRNKTILLYGEQGLGDHLFFLRYAPFLKQHYDCCLLVFTEPKLATILARNPLFEQVITDLTAAPAFDSTILIGDLPYLLLRHTLYPNPLPLTLNVEAQDKIQHLLTTLGPPPYVALTWRGGTLLEDKKLISRMLYKEIDLTQFAESLQPLAGHVTFLSVQRKAKTEELITLSKRLGQPVHNLDALNEDLEQMLALLAVIDEYVGVSNTNMHLMAGLNRSARVLVPYPADWRWSSETTSSAPWFVGFTTYRQMENHAWLPALTQLQTDLTYLTK